MLLGRGYPVEEEVVIRRGRLVVDGDGREEEGEESVGEGVRRAVARNGTRVLCCAFVRCFQGTDEGSGCAAMASCWQLGAAAHYDWDWRPPGT